MCGARANPFCGSKRSSAVSQARHGLTWLARKNAGETTPVIGQAPSNLMTSFRNCNCLIRRLTVRFTSVICLRSADEALLKLECILEQRTGFFSSEY